LSPYYLAAAGDLSALRARVDQGEAITTAAPGGRTPLHPAAGAGHEEVVEYLLQQGAEVDAADTWGRTTLWLAVRYEREEVIRLLLEAGADPGRRWQHPSRFIEMSTDVGQVGDCATVLHVAAAVDDGQVLRLLLDHGAEVDALEYGGRTPLMTAVQRPAESRFERGAPAEPEIAAEAYGAARALLEAGADPNQRDEEGSALLLWALDQPRLVRLLLEAGADPDQELQPVGSTEAYPFTGLQVGPVGRTALHVAAAAGDLELAQLLLEFGADTSLRDHDGLTAEEIARKKGNAEVAELLQD
jgi:ankyrin